MKRCALVFLCLLAAPVGAEARPFTSSEMRMVELAHDHWGKGPACERITYRVEDLGDRLGRAWPCNLRIAERLPWVQACTTVAHEWGHLLQGARPFHTDTLGDLMSESPDTTNECARADERRHFRTLRKRCVRKPTSTRKRCVRRARRAAFG